MSLHLAMQRTVRGAWTDQKGVAMVEAFLGTGFLIFTALIVIQIVLTFHARLDAHDTAMRIARAYALTGNMVEQEQLVYNKAQISSLRMFTWKAWDCGTSEADKAICSVTIQVPIVVPGGGVFGDHGLLGPLDVTVQGSYPIGIHGG